MESSNPIIIFVNTAVEQCGVHQYGRCLFDILEGSTRFDFQYTVAQQEGMDDFVQWCFKVKPAAIIYNWSPLIQSWVSLAPFRVGFPEIMIFHEVGENLENFDAILFSDPTRTDTHKWHYIGRPLPKWKPVPPNENKEFTIGLHGFAGGWSLDMMHTIMGQLDGGRVRLHLPPSPYVDPRGEQANAVARACQALCKEHPGFTVEINHTFLPRMHDLLSWLSQNDINCYVRPLNNWNGVSSALDAALAVRRPIAINKCAAFRHFFGLTPSICLEDTHIGEIWSNGIKPLRPLIKQWCWGNVRNQVEEVICKVSAPKSAPNAG